MKAIVALCLMFSCLNSFAQMPSAADLNAKAGAASASAEAATKDGGKMMGKATASVAAAKEKLMVNLNTAPEASLAKLPGIGPVKAKAIIAGRPYSSIEDLKKVKGIKEAVIAKLKDKVSF